MRYCLQCGGLVSDDMQVCQRCGAVLSRPSSGAGQDNTGQGNTGQGGAGQSNAGQAYGREIAGGVRGGMEDWRTVVPTGGAEMAQNVYAADNAGTYRQSYTVQGGAAPDGGDLGGTASAQYNPAAGGSTYRQTYHLPRSRQGAQSTPRQLPFYDRGVFSPVRSEKQQTIVNVLLVLFLIAVQIVLWVVFADAAEGSETGMVFSQAVGLVPVLLLLGYIYSLDTIEKEPIRLLAKLFLAEGMMAMTAVMIVEITLDDFFSELCLEYLDTVPYRLLDAFLLVALVEELGKYIVLRACTWKHPAFNYRFDGIVYAAVTALGFAAFENMVYVASLGLGTALFRSISAVPGHCVDGILMGIFYGQARCYAARGKHRKARLFRVLSVAVPVLEHGLYDFISGTSSEALGTVFIFYVWLLNAVMFVAVWRLSQRDEALTA